MAGYAVTQLEPCERLEVYVGGLPAVRSWPWEYKAPFAPSDVIEEYVRPARYVAHGELVVREALSEPEPFEMVGVGTLEAFNTDGLRTLARTLDVPHMKEKTLRYPGHIELMRVLRQLGLFSREPIEVDGVWVSPLALTSKLLFPQWTYGEGEEDLTVLRVVAEGKLGGGPAPPRVGAVRPTGSGHRHAQHVAHDGVPRDDPRRAGGQRALRRARRARPGRRRASPRDARAHAERARRARRHGHVSRGVSVE
jgi:hypothetical protein